MTLSAHPTVSVCIATYNQARYIERCVRSALAQRADLDVEIIVADDGSSDGTGDILRSLHQETGGAFELILRPRNIGGTENYQDIVGRARGRLIAELDGDDAWLPGKLAAQCRFLEAHPECVAVYSNARVVSADDRPLGRFTNSQPAVFGLPYLAARGNFLTHSSMLYRAEHRDAYTAEPPPVIDYRVHLNLARRGMLGFIDEPLVLYRHATPTSTVRNALPLVQRLLWDALRQVLDDLRPPERVAAVAHFVAGILLSQTLGKAREAAALVEEAAGAVGLKRWQLLACSAPYAARVTAYQVVNRLLWRGPLVGRRVLHARI